MASKVKHPLISRTDTDHKQRRLPKSLQKEQAHLCRVSVIWALTHLPLATLDEFWWEMEAFRFLHIRFSLFFTSSWSVKVDPVKQLGLHQGAPLPYLRLRGWWQGRSFWAGHRFPRHFVTKVMSPVMVSNENSKPCILESGLCSLSMPMQSVSFGKTFPIGAATCARWMNWKILIPKNPADPMDQVLHRIQRGPFFVSFPGSVLEAFILRVPGPCHSSLNVLLDLLRFVNCAVCCPKSAMSKKGDEGGTVQTTLYSS